MALEEVAARLEIQALLTRYTVAIDTHDWALLDTVFTPDAWIDYESSGGTKGPYPEVRRWLGDVLLGRARVPTSTTRTRSRSPTARRSI
jgi:hypothetical protein